MEASYEGKGVLVMVKKNDMPAWDSPCVNILTDTPKKHMPDSKGDCTFCGEKIAPRPPVNTYVRV